MLSPNLSAKLKETALPEWFSYSVSVPARSWSKYLRERDGKVLLFTILDGPPSDWAEACRVLDSLGSDAFDGVFRKVQAPIAQFTHVAILPPGFHGANKEFQCHDTTIVAVPVFDCEFAPDETPQTALAVQRLNCMVDWTRSPQPWIKMEFDITGTGMGSTRRGFTNMDSVIREANRLETNDAGYIDVENFRHHRLRISKQKGHYSTNCPGADPILSRHGAAFTLKAFLHGEI